MSICIRCLVMIIALSACSDQPQWRTAALDPAFPDLRFELTADSGEVITEERLRGHLTLLFFGYTFCPDVCPTTLARLRAAMDRLGQHKQDRIKVLFVSVDPARDDPGQLAAYTGSFGPGFIGATAELERLRRLTSRYGSSFSHGPREESGQYPVTHGSSVLVFDRDGRARLLIREDDGVEAIAHDLRALLEKPA